MGRWTACGQGAVWGHLGIQGRPGQCHQEGQSGTSWETSLSPVVYKSPLPASHLCLEPDPLGLLVS